ncbi:hypothetical protein PFISCL1PPCAC_3173, partial [Pristionchus fissidentatus]
EMVPGAVAKCASRSSISANIIRAFRNDDEQKFAVLSVDSSESTVLTIGVGNDINAEKSFREVQPNTRFFGADPISQINRKLYSTLGQFFPVAIGNETKMGFAYVLKNGFYRGETLLHLDFVVFIKHFMKMSTIDHLWIDAEGAEYGMFPMFSRGGAFEQENIVICQINMEVHNPDAQQKKLFSDFMHMLLRDKRYIL